MKSLGCFLSVLILTNTAWPCANFTGSGTKFDGSAAKKEAAVGYATHAAKGSACGQWHSLEGVGREVTTAQRAEAVPRLRARAALRSPLTPPARMSRMT